MKDNKVLQNWLGGIPWKQQSVLLSALRGPDTSRPSNVKKITRWLRGILQKNADKSTEYMKPINLPLLYELAEELEYCTVHYFCHFLHAMEIIGYHHPDKEVRKIASGYYRGLIKALHVNPETKAQLNMRLKDRRD